VDKVPCDKVEPVSSDNDVMQDMGAASQVTRGMAIEWPWYENSAPPFNHTYCPTC
jgi:hypothetical protein